MRKIFPIDEVVVYIVKFAVSVYHSTYNVIKGATAL